MHVGTVCGVLLCFVVVLIRLFLTALSLCPPSLHFFLPVLSAALRHFLSGLCQGGMLRTPGIVTLRESTPFKVFFYHSHLSASLLSLSFCIYLSIHLSLSLSLAVYLSLLPVLRLLRCTTPGFSHRHKFTLTHTNTPPLPHLVSFCVRNTLAPAAWWASRLVINKPDCFQNTPAFNSVFIVSVFLNLNPRDM